MDRNMNIATFRRFVLFTVMAAAAVLVGCSSESQPQVAPADPSPADSPAGTADSAAPRPYRSFYRSSGNDSGEPATIPPVLLTDAHKSICLVGVGDTMPEVELPQVGGRGTKLADLYGKKATVVVFWKSDRRMALTELADLGPDVVEPFQSEGVAVVGIAVGESANSARSAVRQTGARFANLLDADGAAFAKVGSDKLPRTYLLDPSGKVLWFDIEYSQATRRELAQSLEAVAGRE
jgi:thioredoxin-dependent peroxiredoxin